MKFRLVCLTLYTRARAHTNVTRTYISTRRESELELEQLKQLQRALRRPRLFVSLNVERPG
jgi:predicted DNA-binding helix-hairpin-helix protein